jgi:hypothetical protein
MNLCIYCTSDFKSVFSFLRGQPTVHLYLQFRAATAFATAAVEKNAKQTIPRKFSVAKRTEI